MVATLIASYTPTDRQPQAFALGACAALEIHNRTTYRLAVFLGRGLRDQLEPTDHKIYTGLNNLTSFPGWLLIVPDDIYDTANLFMDVRIITYGVSDALPATGSYTKGTFYKPSRDLQDTTKPYRSLQRMNVREYGAVGDGITDDTVAIQAALTSVGTIGGGAVYLPAGTYVTSSSLTVSANTALEGDGPGATTIFTTSATADVVILNGTHTSVRQLHISAAAASRTAGAGINVAAQQYDYRITDVNTDNMWDAIHIGNGTLIPNQIYLRNLRLWNSTNAHLFLQSGENLLCSQVLMSNDIGISNANGFLMTGGNGVWMSQCTTFQCGTGFTFQPAGTNILNFGWFINCMADTCTSRGWDFNAGATGTIGQFYVHNSWGSSSGANEGMRITNSGGTVTDVLLDGFQAFNNATHGILVDGGATTKGIDIRGARCAGNSAAVHNTSYGIVVTANINDFSINDSRSGSFAGYGVQQTAGIGIFAGTSNHYSVINNDLTGNTNAAMVDNGAATLKIIKGNVGYNPVGQVTAPAFPATTVAATNTTGNYVTAYIANGVNAITQIQVAGVSGVYVTTGLQIAASGWGTVRIPPNGGVKFTYAGGAPAWTWFGD